MNNDDFCKKLHDELTKSIARDISAQDWWNNRSSKAFERWSNDSMCVSSVIYSDQKENIKHEVMASKKIKKPELVTPAITEEEQIITELKKKVKQLHSEIDELQTTKSNLNAQFTTIRDKTAAQNAELSTILKKVEKAKATLQELHCSAKELQATWEAGTKKMDFILPEHYTENVFDATAHAIREYNNIVFNIVLNKEVTVKKMFGKKRKHVYTEEVKLFTIAKTDAWESSVEWGRTLAYLAAIRKKICSKNHSVDNSTLLSQADDALLSPDIHAKDTFILKLIDQLKNGN